MKIFLAGAGGVIGRRLTPLLVAAGHEVVGTTRSHDKMAAVAVLGAEPVTVDVFDADALARAVAVAKPDVVIHQLTDLNSAPGTPGYAASQERNVRLRRDGTRNLMNAAKAAGARRAIVQSIAFVYAPGSGLRVESDPLDVNGEGTRALTVSGVLAMEAATTGTPGVDSVVLRYGYLYGAGTWYDAPVKPPSVHADAAAHAALLAVTKGAPGIYNIAEDDGYASSDKAKRELGFDAGFRLKP
jgi:nucleoside-diphosphate-sugar epimerase